jgi:hypothetical protein
MKGEGEMFVLKANYPAFVVTAEGEFEYHTFRRGEIYDKVPDGEAYKFDFLESILPHKPKKAKKEEGEK